MKIFTWVILILLVFSLITIYWSFISELISELKEKGEIKNRRKEERERWRLEELKIKGGINGRREGGGE